MKPCRNRREAKTGMATKGQWPVPNRLMNSELDISDASNSSLPPIRSKMSRGSSIGEELEIDAARLHLAGIEAQHAVIEAAGEGQRQSGRCGSGGLCYTHPALPTFDHDIRVGLARRQLPEPCAPIAALANGPHLPISVSTKRVNCAGDIFSVTIASCSSFRRTSGASSALLIS